MNFAIRTFLELPEKHNKRDKQFANVSLLDFSVGRLWAEATSSVIRADLLSSGPVSALVCVVQVGQGEIEVHDVVSFINLSTCCPRRRL